ncbi:MAG: hypothetical protein QT12_C0017G0002 [archaeon GW2011_AR21]|nr:MAG: hypothetical protein QT12_C0017G0002 [archaeon GW2011_AR21]
MPSKKTVGKQAFVKDLYYFMEWTNQLTYLIFFTAILMSLLLLMNYFILLQLMPEIQNAYSLPALIVAMISFGVILIVSVQRKRLRLERQLRQSVR